MARKKTTKERIAHRLLRLSILVCVAGAAFLVYFLYYRVQELRVAVSNANGEDAAIIQSINDWFVSENRRFRLRVVPTGSPDASLEKLRLREVDIASLRGDRAAGADFASVMVLFYENAGIVAPESGKGAEWDSLRTATIGVPRGTAPDDPLLLTLLRLNGVTSPRIVSLETDAVRQAVERRRVDAIGFVSPLPGYASINFGQYFGPKSGELAMPTVEDPDTLAAKDKRYASATIVAASLRATTSVPADVVGTLAVGRHLVVLGNRNAFVIAQLVRNLLDARRALFGAQPLFRQAGAPDLEADAFLKVHNAAKKIYAGDEPSWKDIAIEWVYIAPIIVGAIGTMAVWGLQRYLSPNFRDPSQIVSELLDIRSDARAAETEAELAALRERIEDLADELTGEAYDYTDIEATGTVLTAMLMAENQIIERRAALRDPGFRPKSAGDHAASDKVAEALDQKIDEASA